MQRFIYGLQPIDGSRFRRPQLISEIAEAYQREYSVLNVDSFIWEAQMSLLKALGLNAPAAVGAGATSQAGGAGARTRTNAADSGSGKGAQPNTASNADDELASLSKAISSLPPKNKPRLLAKLESLRSAHRNATALKAADQIRVFREKEAGAIDRLRKEVKEAEGGQSGDQPALADVDARSSGKQADDPIASSAAPSLATLLSLSVRPDNALIPLNGELQYQVVGDFSDGSVQAMDGMVAWTSSDKRVALIGPDGKARGLSGGQVVIQASPLAPYSGPDVRPGKTKARVPKQVSFEFAPRTALLTVGGTQRFRATWTFSEGPPRDDYLAGKWTTSNSDVLDIGQDGVATAKAAGDSAVSFQSNGYTMGMAAVRVKEPALSAVEIEIVGSHASSSSLIQGQRVRFQALGVYIDGSKRKLRKPIQDVKWASDDAASMTEDGLFAAKKTGDKQIIAHLVGSSVVKVIKVKPAPTPIESLTLNAASVPDKVLKPYIEADQSYGALEARIRDLDTLVKPFAEIKKDLEEFADDEVIAKAAQAEQAAIVDIAVPALAKSAKDLDALYSAAIDRCKNEMEELAQEAEVGTLRQEAEKFTKEIEAERLRAHARHENLEAMAALGHNNAESIMKSSESIRELRESYEDNENKFTAQANELTAELVNKRYARAREALQNAVDARAAAQAAMEAWAKSDVENRSKALKEAARARTEQAFDSKARDRLVTLTKTFRFSQFDEAIKAAQEIANVLAPKTEKLSKAASVAIAAHKKSTFLFPGSDAQLSVDKMETDVAFWLEEVDFFATSAKARLEEIPRLRDQANRALALIIPKKKNSP